LSRGEKPWAIQRPFDFDSVVPDQLDRFRFVVATRSPYASSPPPNWHRVRTTRSFDVYERDGPTPPRSVLNEVGMPGLALDCSTEPGATMRGQPGVAAVREAPVLIDSAKLRTNDGHALERGEFHFRAISPGGS